MSLNSYDKIIMDSGPEYVQTRSATVCQRGEATSQFTHLKSPMTIQGKMYRNRLIAASTPFVHSVFFSPETTKNVYRMIENRAEGGFVAVSTGELPVNDEEGTTLSMGRVIDMDDYDGEDSKKIRKYADRVRKHGALAHPESSHKGAVVETKASYVPWGPDAYVREDGVQVSTLNPAMTEKVCNDYRKIPKLVKTCGLDRVLVHGRHGFNMQQSISPRTNRRTDEPDGSVENRARLPKMILEAVHKGVGEDMILELHMLAGDGVNGGMTIDDTVEFCWEIDGMVDIIHISNGLKQVGNQTQTFLDFFDVHGVNVEHVAKTKAAVVRSRVAVIGRINNPAFADQVIVDRGADSTESGRQGFVDPELPNRVLSDREGTIRKCARYSSCYSSFCEHKTDVPLWEKGLSKEDVDRIYSPASMGRCVIDPNSRFGWHRGRHSYPIKGRNALIIDDGVGGLQAAITARKRGHKMTLLEKAGGPSSTINFTGHDEDKKDLRSFENLLTREAGESGVGETGADIRPNTMCSRGIMDECKPDAAIIATGARPIKPPIRGIDRAMNALEAYHNMDKTGRHVIPVGDGLVGCKVEPHLANHGYEVTMIEIQGTVAFETSGCYHNALLDEMDRRGLKQMLHTKVLESTDKGVLVEMDGGRKLIVTDTCAYSMGIKADKAVVKEVRETAGGIRAYVIGDCDRAGKVEDVVHAGYEATIDIVRLMM